MVKIKLKAADVCVVLMGIIGLILYVVMLHSDEGFVKCLTREDGPIENITAFFYFTASVICFIRIATSSQKIKWLLYFWGIFSFICFGEEISWGQRIFSYSIESIQHANLQNEINIHNLTVFNAGTGLIKALQSNNFGDIKINLIGFLSADKLFFMGYIVYFLIIPLTVGFYKIEYFKEKYSFNPPNYVFLITIWAMVLLYYVTAYIVHSNAFLEVYEMFMAYGILIYVLFYLKFTPEHCFADSVVPKKKRPARKPL